MKADSPRTTRPQRGVSDTTRDALHGLAMRVTCWDLLGSDFQRSTPSSGTRQPHGVESGVDEAAETCRRSWTPGSGWGNRLLACRLENDLRAWIPLLIPTGIQQADSQKGSVGAVIPSILFRERLPADFTGPTEPQYEMGFFGKKKESELAVGSALTAVRSDQYYSPSRVTNSWASRSSQRIRSPGTRRRIYSS